jgi:ketosteroid isomerase-like protein
MEYELLELERRFWEASSARDGDFYRTHAADDALYMFPGLASPVTNEECATAVDENATPWAWFRIDEPRFLRLTDDVGLLTYTCRCQSEGAEPLAIQALTIYRAVENGWQLVFHQQTMAPSD